MSSITRSQSLRAHAFADLTGCSHAEAVRTIKSTPTAVHGNLIWQPLLDGRVLVGHPDDGILDLARSMHDQGKMPVVMMSGDVGLDDLPEAINQVITGDDPGCVVVTTRDVAAVTDALCAAQIDHLTSYDISAGAWLPTITVTVDGEPHDIDLAAGHVVWPSTDTTGIAQILTQADAQGIEILDDLDDIKDLPDEHLHGSWAMLDATSQPVSELGDLQTWRERRVALIVSDAG